jgi:hypothetical protein
METFYASFAGICFTLLGLWWVVVQFKYELFMTTRSMRLTAYTACMHFLAPGVLALVAVLSSQEASIWRYGSLVGSLMGLLASAFALRSADLTRTQRVVEIVLLALFMAMLVLSFLTTPLFGIKPVLVEALVSIGVVALGVQYAWLFFTAEPTKGA